MALKIMVIILFIIFVAFMYGCFWMSGDCSREEEKDETEKTA